MHRFYIPNLMEVDKEMHLSEEESRHCIKVLRLQTGDSITLINGKGILAEAEIINNNFKKCEVLIRNITSFPKTRDIHIAVCPTKNMDRIEWLIEKGVELGLTRISFLTAFNSERSQIKMERLEKIALSAMKQSKRYYSIQLDSILKFKEFILENPKGFIAHCEKGKKTNAFQGIKHGPIVIGPEGDFTKDEINFALENGYSSLHFGDYILRTETAALAAIFSLLK